MFIISMKPDKKKVLAVIVVLLLCIAGMLIYKNYSEKNKVGEKNIILQTNSQRIEYLKNCGWIVSEDSVSEADVVIPEQFNDVYKRYNSLQKKQGFNLLEYKGKHAKRYTYEVLNYKSQKEGVRANLLIYNNQIIAGDICSTELDGFMREL